MCEINNTTYIIQVFHSLSIIYVDNYLSLSSLDFCLALRGFFGISPGIIGGGGGIPGCGGGAGMLDCDNFLIDASLTKALRFLGTSCDKIILDNDGF